ncbi:MAG: HAD hydrolase family protein [Lachnospiraceae bacterium]|nr:HAD hydrolase family protein [Lachnospiraceae bacterium]
MVIRILVMDVDGTMTDGKIYIGPMGEMVKCFDVKDGYGIHNLLPQKNIIPVVLTGRESDIVTKRCQELEIPYVIQGSKDKVHDLGQLLEDLSLKWENVAYIGDDLNDLEIMRKVAWAACPCDAVEEVKKICHFIASKEGGKGAIRETIEFLIARLNIID